VARSVRTSSSNVSASAARISNQVRKSEGFVEVAAVIELPGDRRQIFQARRNVVRSVLKDLPPFLLRQLPPRRRFLDRDQRGIGRLGAADLGPKRHQAVSFRHARYSANGWRPASRQEVGEGMIGSAIDSECTTEQRRRRRKRRAPDRREPRHPPCPAIAASET